MRGNGEDELIREAPQRGPQSVAALQRQLMEHEFLILHSSDWPMPRNLSKMEASVHQLEKKGENGKGLAASPCLPVPVAQQVLHPTALSAELWPQGEVLHCFVTDTGRDMGAKLAAGWFIYWPQQKAGLECGPVHLT